MELPKRKKIRLEGYDYSSGGAYFVTICTQNRLEILSKIVGGGFPVPMLTDNGNIIEKSINDIPIKYDHVKIDKFVIMPNHIHLILRITQNNGTGNPPPTAVGTIIAWFKYQITKQINFKNNSAGNRVFQRSFHDHIIRNENEYQKIWEYIDTNPQKWVEDCFYG